MRISQSIRPRRSRRAKRYTECLQSMLDAQNPVAGGGQPAYVNSGSGGWQMRTPTLVLAIALGIVSPAAASPIYQYGFDFSDGTHRVSGVATLAAYDFSPALAADICGPCDPNAILTDFEFTTYDIGGA